MNAVLQYLRQRALGSGAGDLTDRHLLERFLAGRDEAAFEALVRRHGPMVLGVCRRVLGNEADAEDAFQATFLVLARKARSLRKPELLANWLYGVANRTAAKARAQAARRRAHERQVAAMPAVNPAHEVVWRDLRPLLDAEVARLPDKYRVPFVLCYLEGRTNEEAAALLGCPAGTIYSRLAWARERLRGRLARRGLTLTGTALLALPAEQATATVPAPLLNATARAAVLFATGGAAAAAISPRVASITKEALQAMFLNRMKRLAGLLLVLAAAGVGTGAAVQRLRAAKPEETVAGAPEARAEAAVHWREQKHWEAAHVGAIAAALSPDGKALATGDNEGFVKLWDVATAKAVATFPAKEGAGRASALAFSPDGRTLAAGSPLAARTGLWDTATRTERLALPAKATALAFSPDAKTLATGYATEIRLWDTASGKELGTLAGHTCGVHAVAFTPDGRSLVSGAGNGYPVTGKVNGEIRLWDLSTRRARVLLESRETTGGIDGLAVSRDGRRLASAGRGSTPVRLWDLSTVKELPALKAPPAGYPSSRTVTFSPKGQMLAAAWRPPQNAPPEDAAAGVVLWDLQTRQAPAILRVRGAGVTSITFSRDGATLVAAGYVPGPLVGGTVTVWRAEEHRTEEK